MSDETKYLDLGPFYPKKPTATEPPRLDDTIQSPAGLAEDDMSTGASTGDYTSKAMKHPPIEPVKYDDDGQPSRLT
jgi:hypothetical protein